MILALMRLLTRLTPAQAIVGVVVIVIIEREICVGGGRGCGSL